MHPALQGLLTIIVGVGGCVGYFYFSNLVLDKVLFPARGPNAGRNINRANMIRPWLFLFPAVFVLGLYLAVTVDRARLEELGLADFCHARIKTRGAHPGITTKEILNRDSKTKSLFQNVRCKLKCHRKQTRSEIIKICDYS